MAATLLSISEKHMITGPVSSQVDDLTLKEANEAKKFGLSRENYVKLRAILLNRYRESIEGALAEKLREELKKDKGLLKEVEKSMSEPMREKIRIELEKENRLNEAPTTECRSSYATYLKEVEAEADTMAETSSSYGDASMRRLKRNRLTRGALATIGWFSILPASMFMYAHGIWYTSPIFWGVLLSIVIMAGWISNRFVTVRDGADSQMRKLYKISSDYLSLSDDARRIRLTTIPNSKSVQDIQSEVAKIRKRKEEFDEKFTPATSDVNAMRKKVRVQALEDIDPVEVIEAMNSESRRLGT